MSGDDRKPPEDSQDPGRARRRALLGRLAMSAFAGGMLGLSLIAHSRGFWDGLLVAVAAQLLIRGVVRLLPGGRQDTVLGAALSAGAGAAVGTAVGLLAAAEYLGMLAVVGGLVGLLDGVVSWVVFPSRPRTATAEEPPTDPDADLRDGDPEDEAD